MRAGRLIPVVLASLALAACASREVASLRVEQRPAEGLIRIVNEGPRDVVLYYNTFGTFTSPYHMLMMRFRDGSGRVVEGDSRWDGWWTELMASSELYDARLAPPRRPLRIPARGHYDVRRNMDALTSNRRQVDPVVGPCEMQVMLVGYAGMRRSDRRIEALSGWAPEPCPAINAWR